MRCCCSGDGWVGGWVGGRVGEWVGGGRTGADAQGLFVRVGVHAIRQAFHCFSHHVGSGPAGKLNHLQPAEDVSTRIGQGLSLCR